MGFKMLNLASNAAIMIDAPLDIIPAAKKLPDYGLPNFLDEAVNPPLGSINGKPMEESVAEDRDLLQYVKESHANGKLVYCKSNVEVCP